MVDESVGVDLAPITDGDVWSVADFLHHHLNSRLSAEQWAQCAVPPWSTQEPNHGFLLRCGDRIVGVYLAFYSERLVGGVARRVCNLAAWCVQDDYRAHGVRLVRAMLRQRDYEFVDLSPSGNVVDLNTRLGFEFLDTTTAMVPNLPVPSRRGVRLVTRPGDIERALTGHEAELGIYRDHRRAKAALHFVVRVGDEACYVMARRDRRKGLPLFSTLLHVSDPAVLARAGHAPYRHLLLRHHTLVTLAERRIAGRPPRLSRSQRTPRRRMFRSRQVPADSIDYLYSELACVPW